MKLGLLKNVIWEIYFFKNHAENDAGRLFPEIFFL